MLNRRYIAGAAVTGLLLLGGCSGKSDQAGNAVATGNMAANTTAPAEIAARMPKGGLWDMIVSAEGMPKPMKMRTCLADPAPGSNPFAPPTPAGQSCAKNAIVPTASGYTIDMECSANGMTTSVHGSVSGDFSSSYRTELTTKVTGAAIPAAAQREVKSSIDATYVGACPAGMKPGETKPAA